MPLHSRNTCLHEQLQILVSSVRSVIIIIFKLLTHFSDLALGQPKLALSKSMLKKNRTFIEKSQTGVTTYMNKTPFSR